MLQFPEHIDRVNHLMQFSELRHRVISNNLSNVNTPGFRRLDIEFDESLFEATGSQNSIGFSQATLIKDESLPTRMDGNNVDIDNELGQLNRNSMLFETYAQILSSHLSTMRRALGRT